MSRDNIVISTRFSYNVPVAFFLLFIDFCAQKCYNLTSLENTRREVGKMARREDVEMIIKRLDECKPDFFFKICDGSSVGIDCMLRLLYEAGRDVSSGEITEKMGVSTARVAVLVRKAVARGLVERNVDPVDARRTCIRLTDVGAAAVRRTMTEVEDVVGKIIDSLGLDEIERFVETSRRIKEIVTEKAE